MAASTPRPCLTSWGFLVNSLRTLQASARLAAMAVESSRAIWPIDGLPKRSYAGVRRVSKMVRHVGHWIDMVEAVLIIGVLLVIAWLAWQAVTQAYGPVVNILGKF